MSVDSFGLCLTKDALKVVAGVLPLRAKGEWASATVRRSPCVRGAYGCNCCHLWTLELRAFGLSLLSEDRFEHTFAPI